MAVTRDEVIRAIDILPREAWVAQGEEVRIGKSTRIHVEGTDAKLIARAVALLPDVLRALRNTMDVQFRKEGLEAEVERLSAWVAEFEPIEDEPEEVFNKGEVP